MNKLPFNVLYLDINDEMRENYSTTPSTYGGGRIVASSLLDRFDNFHIWGPEECFKEVREEKRGQCFVLEDEDRKLLREGSPLENLFFHSPYDLVVHHFSNININTKLPTAVWPVGYSEPIHPENKHILLFDKDNQAPRFYSNNHVVHEVVIGPKMPPFQEYEKKNLIVNIGRITSTYQSIQIAQLAHKHSIPMIFAGPLDGNGYGDEFMKYVGGPVEYLGVVDDKTKILLWEKAKMTCQFMTYPISVTLSCKEAMARGVIPMATRVGQYRSFIQHKINGFFIDSEEDLLDAWQNRNCINQKMVYDSVLQFSEEKMIESFIEAFNKIWKQ